MHWTGADRLSIETAGGTSPRCPEFADTGGPVGGDVVCGGGLCKPVGCGGGDKAAASDDGEDRDREPDGRQAGQRDAELGAPAAAIDLTMYCTGSTATRDTVHLRVMLLGIGKVKVPRPTDPEGT